MCRDVLNSLSFVSCDQFGFYQNVHFVHLLLSFDCIWGSYAGGVDSLREDILM